MSSKLVNWTGGCGTVSPVRSAGREQPAEERKPGPFGGRGAGTPVVRRLHPPDPTRLGDGRGSRRWPAGEVGGDPGGRPSRDVATCASTLPRRTQQRPGGRVTRPDGTQDD